VKSEIDAIREVLRKRYSSHLVCNATTDLVIEGFPRSANTYTVDMIRTICRSVGHPQPRIAHHTHAVLQLKLAEALDIPIVILLREPLEAISSFAIYSEADITTCVQRYKEFYSGVLALEKTFCLALFSEITVDFNKFISAVNCHLKRPLPHSKNLHVDSRKAKETEFERAQKIHSGRTIRRIAVPIEEREVLKAEYREAVNKILSMDREVYDLYHQVKLRGSEFLSPGG